MENPVQSNLKVLVRGAYDLQKIRIQMGNRIIMNWKLRLGMKPTAKEDTIDKKGQQLLAKIRNSYDKLMDKVKTFPRQSTFKGDEVILNYTEICLVHSYVQMEESEKGHFSKMGNVLAEFKVFSDFLRGVRGIGPAMAGVIVSEIDIHKSTYPSSLWAYAGLDVAPDGAGRSRRKEHLVNCEYENKDGKQAIRKGITFNPFLKSKLIGVLGPSFLRSGAKKKENKDDPTVYRDGTYAKVYEGYKHRLESMEEHKEKSKGHRHNMAIRYMVKIFLVDLHMAWREIEGLTVSTSYAEGKLGTKHTERNVA